MFGATADGTAADHARYCIGLCTEDAQGTSGTAKAACLSSNVRDAVDNINANITRATRSTGNTSARFLLLMSPSAPTTTVVAACDAIDRVTSGVANGVRLNWTTTPDAAYEMVFILFGGLTGQDIQTLATGNTWGFQAHAGFCLATTGSFSTGNSSGASDAQFNFGAFTATNKQGAIASEWDRDLGAPIITDADTRVYTGACIGSVSAGTASTGTVITGITATATTATDPEGVCLALSFSDSPTVGVATETIPGSTGVASFTGLGFTPAYALGFATGVNASDTTTDGASAASLGAFAFDLVSAAYAGSVRLDEGVTLNPTLSDASTLFNTRALLLMDDTGAVSTSASSPAGVTNGFSLNFASAGAGRFVVFGLQLPTITKVQNETVQITDAQVLLLASKLVTSETVLISDSEVMMEQAGVALEDSPRGLCVQGGPIKGMTAVGGAERAMSLS